jgi:Mrp family chromosome partitioning ATPase
MTALDQAFIKAYAKPDASQAATAAQNAESAAVKRKRKERPRQKPADEQKNVSPPIPQIAEPIKKSTRQAPTLDDLGLSGAVFRLDRTQTALAGSMPKEQSVPSPHLAPLVATQPMIRAETPLLEATEDIAPDFDEESADDVSGTADDMTADYPEAQVVVAEEPPTPAPIQIKAAKEPFRPMLRVDRFIWPPVCNRLIAAAGPELDQLASVLSSAMERKQKILAIAGSRRGEGGTTLLLCMARRLAERKIKIALADADSADPQLAGRLGLQPQFDWEAVLAGQLPLGEVVVEAVDTGMALLPLGKHLDAPANSVDRASTMASALRTLALAYDLVLVDPGPLEELLAAEGSAGRGIGAGIDAAVLVQDVRVSSAELVHEMQSRLAVAGIAPLGIVQNLVQPGSTNC